MINFILIAICIISGFLLKRAGLLPNDSHKSINLWIIYVALPAVSFKHLPNIHFSKDLLLPIIAPMIVFAFSWLSVNLYKKIYEIDRPTESILKIITGLSNTSFVGFPLIIAYFGESALSVGVICDQLTFLLFSTFGVGISIKTHHKDSNISNIIIKKLITFPPFIACISALTIPHFIDISSLNPLFDKLASTIGPMALFSVGLQLQLSEWKNEIRDISFALLYKLVAAPAIIFSLVMLLNIKGIVPQISIFETAMPSLLTASILADQYDLNKKLCNLIIGISILTGFITTGLWSVILKAYL